MAADNFDVGSMMANIAKIHGQVLTPTKKDVFVEDAAQDVLREIEDSKQSLKPIVGSAINSCLLNTSNAQTKASLTNFFDMVKRELKLSDAFLEEFRSNFIEMKRCCHLEVKIVGDVSGLNKRKNTISLELEGQETSKVDLEENVSFTFYYPVSKLLKLTAKIWRDSRMTGEKKLSGNCDFVFDHDGDYTQAVTYNDKVLGNLSIKVKIKNKDHPIVNGKLVTNFVLDRVKEPLRKILIDFDDGDECIGKTKNYFVIKVTPSDKLETSEVFVNDSRVGLLSKTTPNFKHTCLTSDKLRIEVEDEGLVSPRAGLPPPSPVLNRGRRASAVVLDALDKIFVSPAESGGRRKSGGTQGGLRPDKEQGPTVIPLTTVEWFKGLRVPHKKVNLDVSLRSKIEPSNFKEKEAKALVRLLTYEHLKNEKVVSQWDGELSPEYENILALVQPLFTPQSWQQLRGLAVVQLHPVFPNINEKVLYKCLTYAAEITDETLLENVFTDTSTYRLCCLKSLAKLDLDRFCKDPQGVSNKTLWIIKCLTAMKRYEEDKSLMGDDLRGAIDEVCAEIFDKLDFSMLDLLNYLNNVISPTLELIAREYNMFGLNVWCPALAEVVVTRSLSFLKPQVKDMTSQMNDVNLKHKIKSYETSFNLYIVINSIMRYISKKKCPKLHEEIVHVFRCCLDAWVDVTVAKTQECIDRVLEMESNGELAQTWKHESDSKHWLSRQMKKISGGRSGRKTPERSPLKKTPENEKILQSFASEDGIRLGTDIDGIFNMAAVTWKKLQWPDTKESITFGVKLIRRCQQIFNQTAKDIHALLLKDDEFAPPELIVALKTVHYSARYMDSFFDVLNHQIVRGAEQELDMKDVRAQIDEVSELYVSVKSDSFAEELIVSFCNMHRKKFKALLRQDAGRASPLDTKDDYEVMLYHEVCQMSEGNELSPVSYLDGLLSYFHYNLRIGSEEMTAKYHDLLIEKLFLVPAEEIEAFFFHYQASHRRRHQHQVYNCLYKLIKSIAGFREFLKIPPCPILTRVFVKLDIKSEPTTSLITKYLYEIYDERETFSDDQDPNNVTGKLKFHAGILKLGSGERELHISLKQAKDLKPRTGRTNTNFSLQVSVLPVANAKASLRERTKVFHDRTCHIFDLADEDEQQPEPCDFVFNLFPYEEAQFLQITLHDHSVLSSTQKYRRGDILMLLSSIKSATSVKELAQDADCAFSKKFERNTNETELAAKIMKELTSRKHDFAAKYFLKGLKNL